MSQLATEYQAGLPGTADIGLAVFDIAGCVCVMSVSVVAQLPLARRRANRQCDDDSEAVGN